MLPVIIFGKLQLSSHWVPGSENSRDTKAESLPSRIFLPVGVTPWGDFWQLESRLVDVMSRSHRWLWKPREECRPHVVGCFLEVTPWQDKVSPGAEVSPGSEQCKAVQRRALQAPWAAGSPAQQGAGPEERAGEAVSRGRLCRAWYGLFVGNKLEEAARWRKKRLLRSKWKQGFPWWSSG